MNTSPPDTDMMEMTGIAACSGVAIGRAFVLDRSRLVGSQYTLQEDDLPGEVRRFERALKQSREQMDRLLKRVVARGAGAEHTGILESHHLMLADPELQQGVTGRILERNINAEWALRDFMTHLKETFSKMDDEYFQERGNDLDQVAQRILRNLLGRREQHVSRIPARSIVVAHDLTPADTVQMLRGQLVAFVTELGGRTSHVAIIARSMQIPALVGVESAAHYVSNGDLLIVDGEAGLLIIRPTEEELERYRARRRRVQRFHRKLAGNRLLPAKTRDGLEMTLAANVEKLEEIDALREHGAQGIGLYRTEYLFLDRRELPDEEEQYTAYRQLVEQVAPQPVVFRTLDVGADKGLLGEESTDKDRHLSPALGLRGIRYSLRHPELFLPQLRALLRASVHGPVKIMIPMVTSIDEVQNVKQCILRCRQELEASGLVLPAHVPLGLMIETPAAAYIADILAREVDFFSIGTNDLIHYTIAIDRLDERLAYLYQPVHPAILRMLQQVVNAAAQAGIDVSLCGEVAGEPLYTLVLMGLGLRSLSMSPVSIPAVKDVIRRSSMELARALAEQALQQRSGYELQNWLLDQQQRHFPQTI